MKRDEDHIDENKKREAKRKFKTIVLNDEPAYERKAEKSIQSDSSL
jgi:hypothetical protein